MQRSFSQPNSFFWLKPNSHILDNSFLESSISFKIREKTKNFTSLRTTVLCEKKFGVADYAGELLTTCYTRSNQKLRFARVVIENK